LGLTLRWFSTSALRHRRHENIAEAALKRTTDWAKRARQYFLQQAQQNGEPAQWQFGIVQGATFPDLRCESARQLLELDFPRLRCRRLAVGEPHEPLAR